ncbi:MAG: hypothetical protein DWB42_10155 [Chloroflexi bacterium]|nr:hypothetical protein [Chloroflexota bacterium]
MPKRGCFVVLEGNQGLGKTTQAQLLTQYMARHNIAHRLYCFPRYDSFFGQLAAAFLRGEHGSVESTSPYLVALIFANDRLLVRDAIRQALEDGMLVLADRWVSSNLAVQASKFENAADREAFSRWVQEMEYDVFGQPRPDLTVYLRARPEATFHQLRNREQQKHLKGKTDIEESNNRLIYASFEQYERLAAALPNWAVLDVERQAAAGEPPILSIQDIHLAIINLLRARHILP